MKKLNSFFSILMLLLAVLFAQNSWGQTYLTESFEGTWSGTPGTAPSGWYNIHTTGGTTQKYWAKCTWSGSTWSPSGVYGAPTTPTGAYDGSAVAWYNDANASATQKDQLTTNNIDLSAATTPRVTFYLAINASSSLTLKLRGSNDGGGTWVDIQTITKPGTAWTKVTVSIPATYKVSNARFGLEVTATFGSYDVWMDKFVIDETPVALTGTKTIKSSGGDYATFTAAINALNEAGVGAGGVTFNVDADLVTNENCPVITATGTSSDQIIFQKSGAGANPKITPNGTTGTADAGLILQGSDYITFDGIDIDASAVTAVEYGYLIRNATATNGAQYNTIKNCAITLNRGSNSATSSSSAILQTASSTGGGVVPSNATGANSYNKYYNLTIQSALNGVYLNGNGSYRDLSCEVGTSSASTRSSITNLGPTSNTSVSARGIYAFQQEGVKIFNNDISSVAGDQAATHGIYFTSGYGNSNEIYGNKIHTINVKGSTSTTASAYGLRADLSTSGTHNVRIYNNFISNIYTSFTSTATISRYAYGMFIGIASATSSQSYDIDNNSISIGSGLTPTYSNTCYELQSSSPSLRFRGNIFANYTNAQTGVAKHFCAIVTAAGIGGTGTALDYNDYYIANSQGTSGHVGRNGSSSTNYNTIADWKTFTTGTLDDNSFSSDPNFINNNTDLHTSAAALNTVSGFSTQAWVTTDIDNEDRSTLTPSDVGADAFTPANMAYSSSTTTQTIVTNLDAGATNQQVIGIQVLTTGALNPIDLTKIVVNANGTTSVSDISNAKIWYTGTSSTFATTAQFGSIVASPTTANFEVTGTQTLAQGTNYFWLTYDVASTAVNANVVDAECTSVTVGGSDYAPTVTAPAGTRAIVNKTITSVSGTQASTALVLQVATNQAVLRLDFAVAGPSGGSLLLNSIAATYTGTSASDIAASGVKLYWTTTTSFATINPLGSAQSLSGGVATFSGLNYNLPTGTSYVWVAFDIDAAAAVNNTVDAKIAVNGIDVAGTTYPVAEIDPVGTRTIKAALAGTYTVGTGGNYTSFTKTDGLFADINSLGLSGNVTINVISDITDETGATALNQWTETGAGNYTFTIQPDGTTLRTISGTAVSISTPMINFNGADRVTIDGSAGKYLTFRNTNSTASNTGATIQFTNSSTSCLLNNCIIENNGTASTRGVITIGTGTNSVTVSNSDIRDAITGTAGSPAIGIYSSTSTNTITVANNNIFNWKAASNTGYGIYFSSVADGCSITGNNFYYNLGTASALAQTAIYVASGNNHTISGNYIGGQSANCGGSAWTNTGNVTFTGLYLGGSTTSPNSVQGNIIQNISLTGTGSSSFTGISIVSGNNNIGTSSQNVIGHASIDGSITIAGSGTVTGISFIYGTVNNTLIANIKQTATIPGKFTGISFAPSNNVVNITRNMIHTVGATSSSTGTGEVVGIYTGGSSGATAIWTIANNIISLGDGVTNNNVYKGFDDWGYSGNIFKFYYNSIRIAGTANGSSSTYAFVKRDATTETHNNNIYVNLRTGSTGKHYAIGNTNTSGTFNANYNNYFVAGGVLGVYSSTDKTTIANWKAATAQDAASKSFNPGFTSATDLSLLVSNNLGTPISGITTDYSGVTRDLTNPDMGAYENNTTNALTFNGATDAWEVASNWTPNVVPNLSTNVIIPANKLAVVNSNNYECNNLTIAPKGELTINAGKDLLVNGTLMLQSDVTGTASLVENGTLLASSTTAQRYIAKDNSWHFLSSPVAAQAIKPNFAPTTCDQTFDFYKWDATANLSTGQPWVNLRATANSYNGSFETEFAIGRGYLVAYSNTYGGNETHEFTGTLNSGDKSIAVVYDANNKFNLIGNPYPSAIDWNASGYANRDTYLKDAAPSIWIWNGTIGQYGAYIKDAALGTNDVSNVIAPNQAFFVEAQANGNFTIPNDARVHPGTQNFLKSTPVDLLKLKVTSTANTYSDEIIVNFSSNATANQGAAKWFSMIAQAPSLYSVKNNKNFSINTLAAINADLIVPVGFKAGVNGNYSIKASELASFSNLSNLILKDLQTGITQNLLQNPVYNFASSTADNANRFQLIFNSTSGINNLTNNSSVIYYADNQIQIQSNNQIERLEIYNAIGQLVYQSNTKSNQLSVNVSDFNRGTYIVRLIANQKIQTQKLILNN